MHWPFRTAVLLALALLSVGAQRGTRAEGAPQPNIVFILADDLGWHDVGYHGSEIKTPNIDRIASGGVKLEQFYVAPVCTPTRAGLMTGRYPMRYGLQVGVIHGDSDYGLSLDERTLPQALKSAGYSTSIVGKWHLGDFDRAYRPTARGFDHQYGLYGGLVDYFTHETPGSHRLDWHRDDQPLDEKGYSTELIGQEAVRQIQAQDPTRPMFLYVPFNAPHGPLQAPQEYMDRYQNIASEERRTYAAMVTCMDDQIGKILETLQQKGMQQNTLVVFLSDNGGHEAAGGSNRPLRGEKGNYYEGGVHVPCAVYWPAALSPGVINEPLHVVDWYPTLLQLGHASLAQKLPLDGRDMWPTITEGRPSPNPDILIADQPRRGAIRVGDWKLIVIGSLPERSDKPLAGMTVELFNLADDPEEREDLAAREPARVRELFARLNAYSREAVPPLRPDPREEGDRRERGARRRGAGGGVEDSD